MGNLCSGPGVSKHFTEETPLDQSSGLDLLAPVLQNHGKVYTRTGLDYARPARLGEAITHMLEGQLIGTFRVTDETSMVITTGSAIPESFPMSSEAFARAYDTTNPVDPVEEHIRKKGYKRYRRKSAILAASLEKVTLTFPWFRPGLWYANSSGLKAAIIHNEMVYMTHPEMDEFGAMPELALHANWKPKDHAPSQAELLSLFLPVLKREGVMFKRSIPDYARPAKVGESITTVVEGVALGQHVVEDSSSWVIRSTGMSAETYVKTQEQFLADYTQPGTDVDPEKTDNPGLNHLRAQGFKVYQSKKTILAKVLLHEEVMSYMPAGTWKDPAGTIMNANIGSYVGATFPQCSEIFLMEPFTLEEKYSMVPDDTFMPQQDMHAKFLPFLEQRGRIFKKCSGDFARPARKGEEVTTIIRGEVKSRVLVKDDTSWVICSGTQDRHRYVKTQAAFEADYIVGSAKDLPDESVESDQALKSEGFKLYTSSKQVRACQLEADDLKQRMPSGKYWMDEEQGIGWRASAGDYIVCPWPSQDAFYTVEPDIFCMKYVPEETVPRVTSELPALSADPEEGLQAMISFNAGTALADASDLTVYLNSEGVKTFCTATYCPAHPGSNWQTATNLGVKHAKIFILLINKGWLLSQECQNETQIFFRLMKSSGSRHMIPVLYQDISDDERTNPHSLLFNLSTVQQVSRATPTWHDEVLSACSRLIG